MTVQDYKRAAAELRAFNQENRLRMYYHEFLDMWVGANGVHGQFSTNWSLETAKHMAMASARAQLLADYAFNNI